MKKCKKCNNSYSDNYDFCTLCGNTLDTVPLFKLSSFIKQLPKQTIITITMCSIIVVFILGYFIIEHIKFNEARQDIEDYKIQKYIDEQRTAVNTWDLDIEDGWTWEKDGNYIYIRGSVKNVGDDTISYFAVTADFLNADGDVIDSDWTNDGDELEPNESRKFEIMHEYDSSYKKVKLEVSEVS